MLHEFFPTQAASTTRTPASPVPHSSPAVKPLPPSPPAPPHCPDGTPKLANRTRRITLAESRQRSATVRPSMTLQERKRRLQTPVPASWMFDEANRALGEQGYGPSAGLSPVAGFRRGARPAAAEKGFEASASGSPHLLFEHSVKIAEIRVATPLEAAAAARATLSVHGVGSEPFGRRSHSHKAIIWA